MALIFLTNLTYTYFLSLKVKQVRAKKFIKISLTPEISEITLGMQQLSFFFRVRNLKI